MTRRHDAGDVQCSPPVLAAAAMALVVAGTVWLTHDGQAKDVILEAGQSHCCDSNARLGIHALAGSTVTTV